jgi:hypothetical protein
LVDDIDRLATISDDGSDVTLNFAVGTALVFVGLGTGFVDGIADLVTDPSAQLLF